MIESTVMAVLKNVCHTEEIERNPHIDLFQTGLLDSLGTVELIVQLSSCLNIQISPSEIDRESWSTPQGIIEYLTNRAAQ